MLHHTFFGVNVEQWVFARWLSRCQRVLEGWPRRCQDGRTGCSARPLPRRLAVTDRARERGPAAFATPGMMASDIAKLCGPVKFRTGYVVNGQAASRVVFEPRSKGTFVGVTFVDGTTLWMARRRRSNAASINTASPGCWPHPPRGVGRISRQSFAATAVRSPGTARSCVDVRGSRSVITRRLDGVIDQTVSERGTIWLRPAGVQEGLIDMSEPVPAILNLYLPPSRFSSDNLGQAFDTTAALNALRHKGGFHDPLLAEIAYAIMSELEHETSAGKLLAETLALWVQAV